jgi:hypothetical protein
MKRILLSSTFVFACLLGACSNEDIVVCEVAWSAQDDTELGTGTIEYAGDDVDVALADCQVDQETHEERPSAAVKYTCNCST